MFELLIQSTVETMLQVSVAMVVGVSFGIPVAVLLWLTKKEGLRPCPVVSNLSDFLINVIRSVPYIILIVLMIPLTRCLVGSSIGVAASIVPLSMSAILLVVRVSEDVFKMIPKGLIEAAIVMGSSPYQIIRKFLLPESLPALIGSITTVTINVIGFSAMAGAVGGGGLGDLAIRYGYQRYELKLLFAIVIVLVVLVQVVQVIGSHLSKRLKK